MHHLTLVSYNYQRAYFARLKQKEDLCFLRISENAHSSNSKHLTVLYFVNLYLPVLILYLVAFCQVSSINEYA